MSDFYTSGGKSSGILHRLRHDKQHNPQILSLVTPDGMTITGDREIASQFG